MIKHRFSLALLCLALAVMLGCAEEPDLLGMGRSARTDAQGDESPPPNTEPSAHETASADPAATQTTSPAASPTPEPEPSASPTLAPLATPAVNPTPRERPSPEPSPSEAQPPAEEFSDALHPNVVMTWV